MGVTGTIDMMGDFENGGWLDGPCLVLGGGATRRADTNDAATCLAANDDGGDVVNARIVHTLRPGEAVYAVASAYGNSADLGLYGLAISCP